METTGKGHYVGTVLGVRMRSPAWFGEPLDFFSDGLIAREFQLLDFWPNPGICIVRLECVGKNPRSAGYALGIESVRLLERRPRVAEYGHDKNKDWRKSPILYD